ncbi:MAG: winged helix-turn-helix domain-containing protein [Thermoplasmatota archaeon]
MGTRDPEIQKPDLYVIARFLERIWSAGRPIKKTRLQMAVGLNYGTFKRYLLWMVERDLLSLTAEEDRSEYVALTTKGLESHHQIVGWIKDVVFDDI